MGPNAHHESALQRKLKANIPFEHPVLKWMVIYAGQLLTSVA